MLKKKIKHDTMNAKDIFAAEKTKLLHPTVLCIGVWQTRSWAAVWAAGSKAFCTAGRRVVENSVHKKGETIVVDPIFTISAGDVLVGNGASE